PGRTAEGTAAFFSVTLLIGWATMDAGFVAAAVAAAGVTLVDAAPFPLNDTLLIPLAGAAACHWGTALPILFGPRAVFRRRGRGRGRKTKFCLTHSKHHP